MHEEHAARRALTPVDLAARKEAIGTTDLELLGARLAQLGQAWEVRGETLAAARSKDLQSLRSRLAAAQEGSGVAKYQVAEATRNADRAAAAAAAALTDLEAGDADALLRSIDGEIATLRRDEEATATQLSALGLEQGTAVNKARQAVDSAETAVATAKDGHARLASELQRASAERNALIGELKGLEVRLTAADRIGAEDRVRQRTVDLAAVPSDLASQNDADLAHEELLAAKREVDEAQKEFHMSEGALSKVGGAAVREEVDRVSEALTAASARERDLEVDADSWKLLLETLRDVENEESAHLGRALEGAVTTKFVELTGGRYSKLRLAATLTAEAVDSPSAGADNEKVLDALSAGTRDQLATLIRLTIASQLKSAIVLDDHLVHTDPTRLAWFREMLVKTAVNTQVIVFTCRPEDYLTREELPVGVPSRDLAGGTIRAVDMAQVLRRASFHVAPSVAKAER
jgi:hypothetical protein